MKRLIIIIILISVFPMNFVSAQTAIYNDCKGACKIDYDRRMEIINKIEKKLDDSNWQVRQETIKQLEKIYEHAKDYGF